MKIQTNYIAMTDEQLATELKHRYETFGKTLGGYEEGGLKTTINNKERWLDSVNDDGSLEFVESFDSEPGDVCLLIEPEQDIYHETLINLLTAKYQIYHIGKFEEETDQQEQLDLRKCEICRENSEEYRIHDHMLVNYRNLLKNAKDEWVRE